MSFEPSFLVYKSSAGSGKTHRLTVEYLKMALRQSDSFRRILGVTFTNKATEEMKTRIVEVLEVLSKGTRHNMTDELKQHLDMTDVQLQSRAQEVLSTILHQYGQFAIVTIDSFFHQVIRSFAREMSLQGTFAIDLNTENVMRQVIDNLLAELGDPEHQDLRKWLTQFAKSKVEAGERWDVQHDIESLSGQLISDKFKGISQEVLTLSEEPGYFQRIKKQLDDYKKQFEAHCIRLASEGADLVQSAGGIDLFKSKDRGPAGWFGKVKSGEFKISDPRRAAAGDVGKWLKKEELQMAGVVSVVEGQILPKYQELIDYLDEEGLIYNSVVEASRFLYTFGILAKVNQQLIKYRDENDLILIADLPDFLSKIINDSDTPYIYEKVGSRYHHYLIDEFQDTSSFQWNNFKPLVKNGTDEGEKSLVVGDVKQSIYRWRGGDWRLLQDRIAQDIGQITTKEENLDTNWRSSKDVVAFNNSFFGQIREVSQSYFEDIPEEFTEVVDGTLGAYDQVQQLVANEDLNGRIEVTYLENEDESTWREQSIHRTIKLIEDLQDQGCQLRDIALLTRNNREGKLLADSFMLYKASDEARSDLKYDVVSSEALFLYSSDVVRLIVSLINWLDNQEDRIALAEWFSTYFVLSGKGAKKEAFLKLGSWDAHLPIAFKSRLDQLSSLPLYELVETIVETLKLNEVSSEYTYLQGFQDAVLDYSKNERGDIPSFLSWWEEVRKERAIQVADENNAIKVLTIHKAKGLEYPIVIIPFLSWGLDNSPAFGNAEIMWADGTKISQASDLPVVPIRYSQRLINTVWADMYVYEHINAYVDNLNLLYVAFTRPINGLYVFSEWKDLTKSRSTKMSNVGDLARTILEKMDGWDDQQRRFEIGELPDLAYHTSQALEYGLSKYPSKPWRSKISLQMRGANELSEKTFDAQGWGVQLHAALSKIIKLGDQYEESEDIKRTLKLIIHHDEIEPFFDDPDEVIIEKPILLPGGATKRIDRLIQKNGTWKVIDFKSGQPRKKDVYQVEDYKKVLSQMGYENLEGYLVYLDPVEVVKV